MMNLMIDTLVRHPFDVALCGIALFYAIREAIALAPLKRRYDSPKATARVDAALVSRNAA